MDTETLEVLEVLESALEQAFYTETGKQAAESIDVLIVNTSKDVLLARFDAPKSWTIFGDTIVQLRLSVVSLATSRSRTVTLVFRNGQLTIAKGNNPFLGHGIYSAASGLIDKFLEGTLVPAKEMNSSNVQYITLTRDLRAQLRDYALGKFSA